MTIATTSQPTYVNNTLASKSHTHTIDIPQQSTIYIVSRYVKDNITVIKYSDGWIQQYGYALNNTPNGLILFAQPYESANSYYLQTTPVHIGGIHGQVYQPQAGTNTLYNYGFNIPFSSNGRAKNIFWKVCGYINGNINNSFSYDISNYCTCITYANDTNGNVYVSNATKQYNVHLIGSISNNMIYMQVIIYLAFYNGPFAPASIYLTIPYNKLGDINKNKLLIPNNSTSIYISSWSNATYPSMTPVIDYPGGDYFRVHFGGNNLTGAAENITLNISGNVS